MPAAPKSGPSLFLGIELATDQFRASIVDESLELVGVECVDFDTELPEYQTQGGIFTTPGDAYTTPVEMWIKGLDALFGKLHRNYDLTRIRSIGGSAQHALVWWKSTAVPSLSSLDPHIPLHTHFTAQSFSLPNTPTAQDTSSHTHALAVEALLGGPDAMSRRVGTCASASLIAAQLLRVRESWNQDVWLRTGRVQLASAFVCSLITGKWVSMSEAEACATGMWVHGGNNVSSNGAGPTPSTPGPGPGNWDDGVLDIVGGSRDEGRRIRGWLGEVDLSGGSRRAGNISRYLVERYGFDPETIITPFVSDYLSAYMSLCPSPNDVVLTFGPMDLLMTTAQHYTPTRLYNLFPHPAQDPGEKRRYVAVLSSRNADVPRALVRDMYTKSWSAFDRLVAIVPPGGSIGLDDKLFSFWHLQADSYPFSHVKGIFRFETGIKVNEFRDLRANPRCLLESQLLSFRAKWSRMIATGLLGSGRKGAINPSPANPTRPPNVPASLGLTFDPYDHTPLPSRIIATGAAANFPSVANLVGDIFNASVFVPQTQVDSAQVVPHRNAPAQGFASRPALGSAYMARWVWGREWGTGGLGGFEDEMKRLLGKRWIATGGLPLRTNINAVNIGGLHPGTAPGSGHNSGSSTPYGPRSTLGNVLVEEEEEETELDGGLQVGLGGVFAATNQAFLDSQGPARARTLTGSTNDTVLSSGTGSSISAPSTVLTTPDLTINSSGALSPGLANGAATTPTTPTPLTPVVALPTSDAEAQLGLAKVAEPDLDAFMTYAAIVPEYCRLEAMLIKGIV
ncbi:actin-like ATPase domain-containing protein [Pluteus cervinus]|uniref:Actin-like ATPase domain-containing protein n=1 Tax=Pluteus cervinus TaxID=181527 RepID=A0ACD3A619_9AGAR|nr:actin-like ATPase domain-containing protein [Pluteus cervinus]